MKISGYVPVYNNASTARAAVQSLLRQEPALDEVFAVDDGSTDGGGDALKEMGVRVLRNATNLGRGAVRNRAMLEARGDLVICCDATNVVPSDFVARLLPWFNDPKVAAAYGRIQDPDPKGAVDRWRSRHLFKANYAMEVSHHAALITFGTMVRRSSVLEVGNFDCQMWHSEDADLGKKLLDAGYDIIGDPAAPVYCNVRNSLMQVLERYWRWYAGPGYRLTLGGFAASCWHAIRVMAWSDLKRGELPVAAISLCVPWYHVGKALSLQRTAAQ